MPSVEKFLDQIKGIEQRQVEVKPSWVVRAVRSDIVNVLEEIDEIFKMIEKLKDKIEELERKLTRARNYARLALRDLTGEEY